MNKKELIEAAALVVGAVGIFLALNRGNMNGQAQPTVAAPTTEPQAPPNYLNYNQNNPGYIPLSNVSSLSPNQASTLSSAPSACGGSGTTMFASDGSFESALNNSLGDIVSQYNANVLQQFPDYVAQFFNNVAGADEDAVASTQFASMNTGG